MTELLVNSRIEKCVTALAVRTGRAVALACRSIDNLVVGCAYMVMRIDCNGLLVYVVTNRALIAICTGFDTVGGLNDSLDIFMSA